ncbi:MAG: ABC transporter permease subunit [bacterium]
MQERLTNLFELRGNASARQNTLLGIVGVSLWLFSWWLFATLGILPRQIAPGPFEVLGVVPDMHFHDMLVRNVWFSFEMNLLATFIAIVISVPMGLALGLLPFFRGMSTPFFVGLRFLPLPVATILFMAWLGIGYTMKTAFLTVAIAVYLVPTVIQRVDEVRQVYVDTVRTLGANEWQLVRYVYLPDVFSRVWDDIVILVGLSWTYISFIELINKGEGGIGALIYSAQRTHSMEKYYALLLIIMFVAFIQTAIFKLIGRVLFPYKRIGG